MIDHNHPAVEAANKGVQEWLAGDGPFDDDPARLASDMTAVCITAALPLLESATEGNIARLRNTPAGKQLLAEGWEAACRKVIHMAWADSSDAEYLADEGNPYRTETPQ